jgi:hypothetical protein
VGSQTVFLDRPPGKDVSVETVADLRHLLTMAGYQPDDAD